MSWATFTGGPIWVPAAIAITTALLVVVQAVLNTVRDIAPQRSKHRLKAAELLLAHLTTWRRDRIKERRDRAEQKARIRRRRIIVLTVTRPPGQAQVPTPRRGDRRPLVPDRPFAAQGGVPAQAQTVVVNTNDR